MNSQNVIMVQIADRAWTVEALHSACVMARRQSAKIALVKFIPVQHLGWLGTHLGYLNLSEREQQEMRDYESTLEGYDVDFTTQLFQYATLPDAISQAADHLAAQTVFATLPRSIFSFWRSYELRKLHRQLLQNQRELIVQPAHVQPLAQPMIVVASRI